jgi:hypothetical protein
VVIWTAVKCFVRGYYGRISLGSGESLHSTPEVEERRRDEPNAALFEI